MTGDPRLPRNGRLSYPQALLWIGLRDFRAIDQEMNRNLGWATLSAETVARHIDTFLQTAAGVADYGPVSALKTALAAGTVRAFGARNGERTEIPSEEWRFVTIAGRSQELFGGAHGEVKTHSGRQVKWDTLAFDTATLVATFPVVGEPPRTEPTTPLLPKPFEAVPSRRGLPQLQNACRDPQVLSLAFSSLGSAKPSAGKIAIAVAAILNTRGHGTSSGSIASTWRKTGDNNVPALKAMAGAG